MVNPTSPPVAAVSGLASSARDWIVASAALAVGLCSFAIIFRPEIATAFGVWRNSDAYSHCFLVLPVALYLAWDRRALARATLLRPAPGIALLAIPAAAAWFAADRLGLMEGRQLMALTLFQIMVAALLGSRMWRAFAAPLLYLFFLVPFGEFLVPPLQNLAVHFTRAGLDLFGIPNFTNGITIEIPEGTFLVHQACSGLRFLIATIAFSVLYACLIYTSPVRRILFVALSFAVAVIGNDLRVLGIVLIAHFIGNTQAVETDHVLWGGFFYVIILSALILIGLPFRQERPAPVRANPLISGGTTGASIIALTVMILLATMPRLAADYLDELGAGAAVAADIAAPALPGCMTVSLPAPPPGATDENGLGAGVLHPIGYRCGGDLFVVTLRRYSPRIGARPLFLSLRAAEAPPDADIIRQTDGIRAGGRPDAPLWRVTESQTDGRYAAIATALWLDGRPAAAGIAGRANQALNTLRPSPVSPVVAVISHSSGEGPNNARRALDRFLDKTAPFSELVGAFLSQSQSVRGGR
jgi:exosortase A